MNTIKFLQTGGFPIDLDTLNFMQSAYTLFNAFGEIAGNYTIISGCNINGSSVSKGTVYINGELLEFRAGTLSPSVVIRQEATSMEFENGEVKPTEFTRYATFGSGSQAIPWSNFKRIFQTKNIQPFKEDLETRISEMENEINILKKAVPIGLVAIWGKPAEEIPQGWVEHKEMQGFTPVGHQYGDTHFGTLNDTIGEKEVSLKRYHIPKFSGTFQTISANSTGGSGIVTVTSSDRANILGGTSAFSHKNMKIDFGEGIAHNNIQPSRIVKFIRFVGFSN